MSPDWIYLIIGLLIGMAIGFNKSHVPENLKKELTSKDDRIKELEDKVAYHVKLNTSLANENSEFRRKHGNEKTSSKKD